MLITALYNVDSTKAIQIKTFVDIDKANAWVADVSKSSNYTGIRLLVEYANVEHYKTEFEKYQNIVLNNLIGDKKPSAISNTIGLKVDIDG